MCEWKKRLCSLSLYINSITQLSLKTVRPVAVLDLMKPRMLYLLMFGAMCHGGAHAVDYVTIDKIKYGVNSSPMSAFVYEAEKDIAEATIPAEITYNKKKYPVTSINSYAFDNCRSLTSVEIGQNITSIGAGAFSYCSSLGKVDMQTSSLSEIVSKAFFSCSSLKDIVIPSTVTTIGFSSFNGCSSLEAINFPEGLTTLDKYAFRGCSSLHAVDLPSKLTSVGDYAFMGCSSLSMMTIADGNDNITTGNQWISGCPIETVYFGRPTIQYAMFEDDSSLSTLTLSANVSSVDRVAFSKCDGISMIISLNPSAPAVEDSDNEPQFTTRVRSEACLVVPDGALSTYQNSVGWKSFSNITTQSGVSSVMSDARTTGCVYSLAGRLVARNNDSATISGLPAGVYIIGNQKYVKR